MKPQRETHIWAAKEALADCWEEMRLPHHLYSRFEKKLSTKRRFLNRSETYHYVFTRNWVTRYFAWRRSSVRFPEKQQTWWLDQLAQEISRNGLDYLQSRMKDLSTREQLLFALWCEGLTASGLAYLVGTDAGSVQGCLDKLKQRMKLG